MPLSGRHILICDDDASILRPIEHTLRRAGAQVTLALNGLEAWQALQQQSFDLLITDYQMPYMNGFELCQLIRSDPERMHLLILLLTAKTFEYRVEQICQDIGCSRILAKPFGPRQLMFILEELLINDPLHVMSPLINHPVPVNESARCECP